MNVFLQYENLVVPNLKTVFSLNGLHGSYGHFMELTNAKHGERWCQLIKNGNFLIKKDPPDQRCVSKGVF